MAATGGLQRLRGNPGNGGVAVQVAYGANEHAAHMAGWLAGCLAGWLAGWSWGNQRGAWGNQVVAGGTRGPLPGAWL